MSLTSDAAQRAGAVLDRAAAARLPEDELVRWRRALDPAKLDLCGCHASLITLVVMLTSGLVVQLLFGFTVGRSVVWLIVAFLSAAVAKVMQRTQAEKRFTARLNALAALCNDSSRY